MNSRTLEIPPYSKFSNAFDSDALSAAENQLLQFALREVGSRQAFLAFFVSGHQGSAALHRLARLDGDTAIRTRVSAWLFQMKPAQT